MNSKNLSKAINRMLAFLLSVAMIATSSFVTPALADVVDGEEIEVVNEIGSEDTSDTVMTTDDSTDDIIVENLEEGGEDLSDGQAADADELIDISDKISFSSSLNKVYDAAEITETNIKDRLVIKDYYTNENLDKDSDISLTITAAAEGSDGKYGGFAAIDSNNKILDANDYQIKVVVAPASNKGKPYKAETILDIKITPLDISTVVGLADNTKETLPDSGVTGKFAVKTWDGEVKDDNNNQIGIALGSDGKPIYTYNSTEKKGYPVVDKSVKVLTYTAMKKNSTDLDARAIALAKALNSSANPSFGSPDTDVALASSESISVSIIHADNLPDSIRNATPYKTGTTYDDTKEPKVRIAVTDKNFTGHIDVPFDIAKREGNISDESAASPVIDLVADKSELNQTFKAGTRKSGTVNLSKIVYDESGKTLLKVTNARLKNSLEEIKTGDGNSIFDTAETESPFTGGKPAVAVVKSGDAWLFKYKTNQAATPTKDASVVCVLSFENHRDIEVTIKVTAEADATAVPDADEAEITITPTIGTNGTLAYTGAAASIPLTIVGKKEIVTNKEGETVIAAVFYDGNDKYIGIGTNTFSSSIKTDGDDKKNTYKSTITAPNSVKSVGSYKVAITANFKASGYTVTKSLPSPVPFEIVANTTNKITKIGKPNDGTGDVAAKPFIYNKVDLTRDDLYVTGIGSDVLSDDDYTVTSYQNTKVFTRSAFDTKMTNAGYTKEVGTGLYPTEANAYTMDPEDTTKILYGLDKDGKKVAIYKDQPYAVIEGVAGGNYEKSKAVVGFEITDATAIEKTDVTKNELPGAHEVTVPIPASTFTISDTTVTPNVTRNVDVTYTLKSKPAGTGFDSDKEVTLTNTSLTFWTTELFTIGSADLVFTLTAKSEYYSEANADVTVTVSPRGKMEFSSNIPSNKILYATGDAIGPSLIVKSGDKTLTGSGTDYSAASPVYYLPASKVTFKKAPTNEDIKDANGNYKNGFMEIDGVLFASKNDSTTKGKYNDELSITPKTVGTYGVSWSVTSSKYSTYGKDEVYATSFSIELYDITKANITWTEPKTMKYLSTDYKNFVDGIFDSTVVIERPNQLSSGNTRYNATHLDVTVAPGKTATKGKYPITLTIKPKDATKAYLDVTKSITKTFDAKIEPNKLNPSSIALDTKVSSTYLYDGKEKKPKVEKFAVSVGNGSVDIYLKDYPDDMYSVEYKNNIDAGNAAKAILKLDGLIKGEKDQAFTIGTVTTDSKLDDIEVTVKIAATIGADSAARKYYLPETLGKDSYGRDIKIKTYNSPAEVGGSIFKGSGDLAVSGNVLSYQLAGATTAGTTGEIDVTATPVNFTTTKKIKVMFEVVAASQQANISGYTAEITAGADAPYYINDTIDKSDKLPTVKVYKGTTQDDELTKETANLVYTWYKTEDGSKWTKLDSIPTDADTTANHKYKVVASLPSTSSFVAEPVEQIFVIDPLKIGKTTTGVTMELTNADEIFYAGTDNFTPLKSTVIVKHKNGTVTLKQDEDYTVKSGVTFGKIGAATAEFVMAASNKNYEFDTSSSNNTLAFTVKKRPVTINLENVVMALDTSGGGGTAVVPSDLKPSISDPGTGDVLTSGKPIIQVYHEGEWKLPTDVPKLTQKTGSYKFRIKPLNQSELAGAAIIKNSSGNDVTGNYDINFINSRSATVIVNASGTIAPSTDDTQVDDMMYTVSFVHPTAEIAPILVSAGKPITDIPNEDDVSEWYIDAAKTKQWNFAADVVNRENLNGNGELVLYAKVVAAPATGSNKLDSDLNNLNIEVEPIGNVIYTGKDIKPVVAVKQNGRTLKYKTDYTISYNKKDGAIIGKDASLDADGDSLSGANEAAYCIIVKLIESGISFPVGYDIMPANIAAADVTGADTVVAKTAGASVSAKPFTALKYNKMTLKAGVDYTYNVNDGTEVTGTKIDKATLNAGVNTVTFTAAENSRNYYGTKKFNVNVAVKGAFLKNAKFSGYDKSMTIAAPSTIDGVNARFTRTNFTIMVNGVAYTYSVRDDDFKGLTGESPFTVTYVNDHKIGTATVTVAAKPDTGFYGSKSFTYKIVQAKGNVLNKNMLSPEIKNGITRVGKSGGFAFKGDGWTYEDILDVLGVDIDARTTMSGLVYNEDYYVSYKKNVNAGTATMTFTAKPGSAYSGKFTQTFKIAKTDLKSALRTGLIYTVDCEDTAGYAEQVDYTGDVTVIKGKGRVATGAVLFENSNTQLPLVEGIDYSITYKNNKLGQTATATVKGKGSYAGSQITMFMTIPAAY